MPRQANGVYQQPANTTAVGGTTISSSGYNTLATDIGTELTNSLDCLGRSSMQASLPMGNNRITGVAAGIAATDGATLGQVQAVLPSGMYGAFFMSTAPSGWLACNGQAVSRTTYAALFAAIGTLYGTGDGSTTFNLPKADGRGMIGIDAAAAVVAGATAVGTTLGEATHLLTIGEMPGHNHGGAITTGAESASHTHNYQVGTGSTGINTGSAGYAQPASSTTSAVTTGPSNSHTHALNIPAQGGGTAHNNVPPSLVVLICIKT